MRSITFLRRYRLHPSVTRALLAGFTLWMFSAPLRGQSRLTVWIDFDRLPDRSTVEWMEQEAGELFSDTGLAISWQLRSKDVGEVFIGPLVSVQFHGKCALEVGAVPPPSRGPMAWLQRQDEEIQPFIEVDCDRTASMVWPNRGTLPLPLVTRAFGRALARVVAHELYHYLTQSAGHTVSDLFRPAMTSMDLTLPQMRFEPAEIEALRDAMNKLDGTAQWITRDPGTE